MRIMFTDKLSKMMAQSEGTIKATKMQREEEST